MNKPIQSVATVLIYHIGLVTRRVPYCYRQSKSKKEYHDTFISVSLHYQPFSRVHLLRRFDDDPIEGYINEYHENIQMRLNNWLICKYISLQQHIHFWYETVSSVKLSLAISKNLDSNILRPLRYARPRVDSKVHGANMGPPGSYRPQMGPRQYNRMLYNKSV